MPSRTSKTGLSTGRQPSTQPIPGKVGIIQGTSCITESQFHRTLRTAERHVFVHDMALYGAYVSSQVYHPEARQTWSDGVHYPHAPVARNISHTHFRLSSKPDSCKRSTPGHTFRTVRYNTDMRTV
eukprot:scaffold4611_cov27-Prasinocladus_malaysianus.AAC.1